MKKYLVLGGLLLAAFGCNKNPANAPAAQSVAQKTGHAAPLVDTTGQNSQLTIAAASQTVIHANQSFSIPAFPDVQFELKDLYKASGVLANSQCRTSPSIYIELSKPNNFKAAPFLCSDGNFSFSSFNDSWLRAVYPNLQFDSGFSNINSAMNHRKAAFVVADLVVKNNSDQPLSNRFLQASFPVQVFFSPSTTDLPGAVQPAPQNISVAADFFPLNETYTAAPHTIQLERLVFMIREDTAAIKIAYGNFGNADYPANPFVYQLGYFDVDFAGSTVQPVKVATSLTGSDSESIDSLRRDAQRVVDVQKIEDAIFKYSLDHNFAQPAALTDLVPKYLSQLPVAPTPPDGGCSAETNRYYAKQIQKTLLLRYCLGNYIDEDNIRGVNFYKHSLVSAQRQNLTKLLMPQGLSKVTDAGSGNSNIELEISDALAPELKVGSKINLAIPGLNNIYPAQITAMEPQRAAAGYIIDWKVEVLTPKNANIISGVDFNILLDSKDNVLAVPLVSVQKGDSGSFVVKIDPNTYEPEAVPVTTGFSDDNSAIEITSGLSAGDLVLE